MIDPKNFIMTHEKYGRGIAVEEYKNEYGICSAVKPRDDGRVFAEWVYPQGRQDGKNVPKDKAIPFRIQLGVKEQAIQILEKLIYMIEGRSDSKKVNPDDIPF